MIEITPRAMRLLKDFFRNKKIKSVRIYVKAGGCGIRTFGISIEKPENNDVVTSVNGFTFVVDKALWEKVKPIKIDADSISFRISGTGIQPNSGCGACGLMCGITGSSRCSGDCLNCTHLCSNGEKVRSANKQSES